MGIRRFFSDKLDVSGVAFFFCCLIIAGLFTTFFARTLSSIGTVGLFLTALASLWQHNTLNNLVKFPAFIGFLLIFLLHLGGFFYKDLADPDFFQRDLLLKTLFFMLPFSLVVLPAISKRRLQQLYGVFVIGVFIGSLYSTGYYLLHFDQVNELYKHSEVVETPTNHVRFSLMVAFAIIIGYRFFRSGVYFFRRSEKWILLGITIWLFIFLHILAVRSGLLAFYLVVGLGLMYDFFFGRKYKNSLLLGFGLILALVAAFYTLPTFYNKFFLTIEDVQSVSNEESAHDYSIAGRVYSYKVAKAVVEENPVFGVGIGNIEAELGKKYDTMFPEILQRGHILPHNQFIYILTAFGFIGLLVFLVGFYYPLFRYFKRFEPLLYIHYFIITFSFLFEATLETQVGLTYSLIFILLPLSFFRTSEPSETAWKNGTFFV